MSDCLCSTIMSARSVRILDVDAAPTCGGGAKHKKIYLFCGSRFLVYLMYHVKTYAIARMAGSYGVSLCNTGFTMFWLSPNY